MAWGQHFWAGDALSLPLHGTKNMQHIQKQEGEDAPLEPLNLWAWVDRPRRSRECGPRQRPSSEPPGRAAPSPLRNRRLG
jgi:hypothetical protein